MEKTVIITYSYFTLTQQNDQYHLVIDRHIPKHGHHWVDKISFTEPHSKQDAVQHINQIIDDLVAIRTAIETGEFE